MIYVFNYKMLLLLFLYRMNHPIKRFRPDEFDKYKINKNYKDDLYYGQECTQSSTLPFILNQRPSSNGSSWGQFDDSDGGSSNKYKMKEKMNDSDTDKNSNNDNLFTSEGLQPSYADLNKIFDNSDDNSNDEHVIFQTIFKSLFIILIRFFLLHL